MTTVKRATPLPSHTSNSELSNRFIEFFDDKITRNREELDSAEPSPLTVVINDVSDI